VKNYKKLEGEKCILSPVDGSAAEIVAEWSNTLDVAIRTGDFALMITCNQQKIFLENMNNEHEYGFLILSHEQDPIGLIRLMKVDFINRNAILGVFIGVDQYRGKGLGQEAIHLILDFAFNVLNLRSVMLETFSFNKSAIQSFLKAGFTIIGRRRKAILYGSREYDVVFMDILCEEFKESLIQKHLDVIEGSNNSADSMDR